MSSQSAFSGPRYGISLRLQNMFSLAVRFADFMFVILSKIIDGSLIQMLFCLVLVGTTVSSLDRSWVDIWGRGNYETNNSGSLHHHRQWLSTLAMGWIALFLKSTTIGLERCLPRILICILSKSKSKLQEILDVAWLSCNKSEVLLASSKVE